MAEPAEYPAVAPTVEALARKLATACNSVFTDVDQVVWRGAVVSFNSPMGEVRSMPVQQAPLWRFFIYEAEIALKAAREAMESPDA